MLILYNHESLIHKFTVYYNLRKNCQIDQVQPVFSNFQNSKTFSRDPDVFVRCPKYLQLISTLSKLTNMRLEHICIWHSKKMTSYRKIQLIEKIDRGKLFICMSSSCLILENFLASNKSFLFKECNLLKILKYGINWRI